MPTDCINYKNSGYFSKIIIDYLDQKPELKQFYNQFPTIGNFTSQIKEKSNNFDTDDTFKREILVATLEKQYNNISTSEKTSKNIELLKHNTTFTITTGHQLNLFTGPLYFLYKIISTINLSVEMKTKYPNYNFVPVYWMATEDHDFEEINYFNFKGKKFRWNANSSGPVGRLPTRGLEEVFEIFSSELGLGNNAIKIKNLFEKAYLEHHNLADATRFLANELFADKGLVIIDADNTNLKRVFSPYIKEELLHQNSFEKVTKTSEKLKDYKLQVNPRAINLFYIEDNLRERIVLENKIYKVNNTNISFTKTEILAELEKYPEKFSPNVILRPLYQEVILPNLCYIGGGGEIAYWLQLKSYFDASKITFPILLLRNSVLVATEKQTKKADKLALSWKDLFNKQNDLLNAKITFLSKFNIDLSVQKEHLKSQFKHLKAIAQQTDPSFTGAVNAQETKQIKGLENLEKRLLKAQKRKYSEQLARITDLQNELFPNKSLQERQANFSEFYIENGTVLIEKLFEQLKPLDTTFEIVVL